MDVNKLLKKLEDSKKTASISSKLKVSEEEVFTVLKQADIPPGEWKFRLLPPFPGSCPDGYVDVHMAQILMDIEYKKDGQGKLREAAKVETVLSYDSDSSIKCLKMFLEGYDEWMNNPANAAAFASLSHNVRRGIDMLRGVDDYRWLNFSGVYTKPLSYIAFPVLMQCSHNGESKPWGDRMFTDYKLFHSTDENAPDEIKGKILQFPKPVAKNRNIKQPDGTWTKERSVSGKTLVERLITLASTWKDLDSLSEGSWLILKKSATKPVTLEIDITADKGPLSEEVIDHFYNNTENFPNLVAKRDKMKKTNAEVKNMLAGSWLGQELKKHGLLD